MKADEWDVRVFCSREESNSIKIRDRDEIFEISIGDRPLPGSPPPVVVITMPELCCINLEGPVEMEAGGFSSSAPLSVTMRRGSYLNLKGFETPEARFLLDGPSVLHAFLSADLIDFKGSGPVTVRLGGRAERLAFISDSPSRLDGTMLLIDKAELDLKGRSEIRLSPDTSLIVKSTDEALIYYNGDYLKEEPQIEGPALLRKY